MGRRIELDRVGTVASIACAIHCALLPVLLGAGAAGALSFVDNRPVEWGLVFLAAIVGTLSAWRGFRRHGNKTVAAVLVLTVLALVVLALSHQHHDRHPDEAVTWAFPVLGLVLAVSHVVNLRLCRACKGCDHAVAEAPARN